MTKLICALERPPNSYCAEIDGRNYGLFNSYGDDPHLFCLLSRCCFSFFTWESWLAHIPSGDRADHVKDIELFIETLTQDIEGEKVSKVLEQTTPLEWYRLLTTVAPGHLAMYKRYGGPSKEAINSFNASVLMRTIVFSKNYRGVLKHTGKVVKVAFRPSPVAMEFESWFNEVITQYKNLFENSGERHA